ncbi:MAG TPA: universal stress protein [Kiritimatiellia bacterium]|nr:universal stress protein [Kiritimatiellia bacterium]
MIKTLLVCMDGSPGSGVAGQYGVYLAKELNASLSALHVLDTRLLEGPFLANVSGWLGAQPFSDALGNFRRLMTENGEAMLKAYAEGAAEQGVYVERRVVWGHPARVILEESGHTELLLLGQRGEHGEVEQELIGSVVERVARSSAEPCLIAPAEFRPIGKILAAYDGSAHAGKALHVAIELALALSAPLVILTVAEDGREEAVHQSGEAMRLARSHECAAAQLILEGEVHEVILNQASEQGCDLIVAGAHGHGRIREWILGSAATHLLHETTLPLILAR